MLHQKLPAKLLLIAAFVALYGYLYGRALLSPASGLDYDDKAAAEWLKIVPFLCTAAWLLVAQQLLRTFGASSVAAWVICALTAASPMVLFLATHHTLHPLFALLATAALLALLKTRPLAAGVIAALACIVQSAGIALVVAGIVTLVSRRRLRDAGYFTVSAMLLIAPAIGWKLAHGGAASNVITHLAASDKAVVLRLNIAALLEAPAAHVSDTRTLYGATVFMALLLWALIRRRQLLPDLFVFLYSAVLLLKIWPPERYFAVALPLLLWMLWRGFRTFRPEVLAAAAILLFGLEAVTAFRQPPPAWAPMQALFQTVRQSTAPGSVIAATLDDTLAFHTGRRIVRGYRRDPFRVFYVPTPAIVTPDVLDRYLRRAGASYVVITPEQGRTDAHAFNDSAAALERGGLLQPVSAPNLAPGYRLLSYVPIVGTLPARNY